MAGKNAGNRFMYSGEGHEIIMRGVNERFADQNALNVLFKLVRFPELSFGAPKLRVTIEFKED